MGSSGSSAEIVMKKSELTEKNNGVVQRVIRQWRDVVKRRVQLG